MPVIYWVKVMEAKFLSRAPRTRPKGPMMRSAKGVASLDAWRQVRAWNFDTESSWLLYRVFTQILDAPRAGWFSEVFKM